MNKRAIGVSYAHSLLWVTLFMVVTVGVTNIVDLIFVDFIHGNPHRTQGNAIFMMAVYTPIFGIITTIGSILVFTVPQFFQAALISIFGQRFGGQARFVTFLALPLTAVLTWYCYDYLTPTDFSLGINVGPDWTPYEHGLSLSRYMKTLAIQAPITLFSFLYFDADFRGYSKKPIRVIPLAIAIVIGLIWGYMLAQPTIPVSVTLAPRMGWRHLATTLPLRKGCTLRYEMTSLWLTRKPSLRA
jgi:hypothetical protein